MEIIGALNDVYALGREKRFQVLDGIDEVVLIRLIGYLCSVDVSVPERIVTQTDDVEIHVGVLEFVVVIRVIAGVGGTVGVNAALNSRSSYLRICRTDAPEYRTNRT